MHPGEELAALAAAAPNLHGASCATPEHRATFDRVLQQGPARFAAISATVICRGCPVLGLCRDWVEGLPPGERPVGVIAGERFGVRRSGAA